MNILIYSDLHHSKVELFEQEPDFIILLGDIEKEAIRLIDQHYSCPKVGVLGNHDPFSTFENTSVVNVHKRIIRINEITLSGFQGSPIYKENTHYPLYEEREVFDYVETMPSVDIFLSHSQPSVKIEGTFSDPHRGFLGLHYLLQQGKTKLLLHGHIHQNIEYTTENTPVISTYKTRQIKIEV